MVDSVSGRAAYALNSTTIHLIRKSETLPLVGNWYLEALGDNAHDNDPAGVCYNYLVNIDGENNLIHPDDIPHVEAKLQSDTSGNPVNWDFRVLNHSGHVKRVYGTGTANEQQHHTTANHSPEDTASIIASKNLLEAVFNTSTLGLHVLKSIRNENGDIIDFDVVMTNATSDRIAGRKVAGMRMLEGWPHTREIGLFDKFVRTVQTGEPAIYEQLYEGDGVRAWFQWMASQLGDGLYVTIENISQRKEAEEALKKTAARLQSTFDGVPAIIALLDVVLDNTGQPVDFIISAANKATSDLRGDNPDDLIGKRMTDFYPEAFRGQLRDAYLDVFKTGAPFDMEYLYPGLERWFSVFVTKQIDGKGIVVAAVDITEKKKSEEQRRQNLILTELNHAKTEFFSNVSHEFRTPLTLMLDPLRQMLKKFADLPVYSDDHAMLQMVYRNALRLEKLVNTLLNFSRIEAGKVDVIFKPTDIAEYTTLLAGNFRSAIENSGLKFVVDCESTEPIYLNQDMWEKIVMNLLSNAFKFTFTGKIEVRLRSLKKHVKLEIRDTGVGINPSDQHRIFERFTRIPNVRSRSYEGTGIGLALVKELVRLHGGNIQVNSKEGEGAVFIVSVPKGREHLPAKNVYELREKTSVSPLACTYAHEAMSWVSFRQENMILTNNNTNAGFKSSEVTFTPVEKETILLVDDNSDIREYIKSILSAQYTVVTAHNGTKAIALIESGLKPELILADLMMPEMDGFELLARVRENKTLADTLFIMLSARASEEDRIQGMRSGVDDYLVKPFSSMALLALVNSRIQRRVTR